MDTFLTRLVTRTLGLAPGVQPLIDPLFAPEAALTGEDLGAGWLVQPASLGKDAVMATTNPEWPSTLASETFSTVAFQGTIPPLLPPEPMTTLPVAFPSTAALPMAEAGPGYPGSPDLQLPVSQLPVDPASQALPPQPPQASPGISALPQPSNVPRSPIEPSAAASTIFPQRQDEGSPAINTADRSDLSTLPPASIAPQPGAKTDSTSPAVTRAPPTSLAASLLPVSVTAEPVGVIQPQLPDNPRSLVGQIARPAESPLRDPSKPSTDPVDSSSVSSSTSLSTAQSGSTFSATPAIAHDSGIAGTLQRLAQTEMSAASRSDSSSPSAIASQPTLPPTTPGEPLAASQSQPKFSVQPTESTLWRRPLGDALRAKEFVGSEQPGIPIGSPAEPLDSSLPIQPSLPDAGQRLVSADSPSSQISRARLEFNAIASPETENHSQQTEYTIHPALPPPSERSPVPALIPLSGMDSPQSVAAMRPAPLSQHQFTTDAAPLSQRSQALGATGISQRFLKQSIQQIRSTMGNPRVLADLPTSSPTGERTQRGRSNQLGTATVGTPRSPLASPLKGGVPWPSIEPRLQTDVPWRDSAPAQHRTSGWPGLPSTAPTTTVQVKIGRIEVQRANPPAPPSRAQPRPTGPTLSLEAYLKQRNGGES